MEFKKGQYVWVTPSNPKHIKFGAKITCISGSDIDVQDDEGKSVKTNTSWIEPMHESCIKDAEDMILLEDIDDATILRNLHIRYLNNDIYTYTGTILAAVNPYCNLQIYTKEYIESYKGCKFGEQPPHIFAMADNSYHNMLRFNKNQSILVSGESGAGKTESSKLLLQFLIAVSGKHNWIEQQILESNCILEAFGNATTTKNRNSSRFGKYIVVEFNSNGVIVKSRIQEYLLEKSRIVHQLNGERSYHIFYSLLQRLNAEEKKKLHLKDVSNYYYINQGGTSPQKEDDQMYNDVKNAMNVFNFSEDEIWTIFKTLAAVLHIGNIGFEETTIDYTDAVNIKETSIVKIISELLEVSTEDFIDKMTKRMIKIKGEDVKKHMNISLAEDVKHALAKGIYGRLFQWIIKKINLNIDQKITDVTNLQSIGLLDIFGLETLNTNSFEQLCINYANECLQQFFIKHVFEQEQEEYTIEEIGWTPMDFADNSSIISFIARDKLSVYNLIDEESSFPNGTDASLLMKLHQNHSENPMYIKPKGDANLEFGIVHYACKVIYSANGFLQKNRDTFSKDLLILVKGSKSFFIKECFENDLEQSDITVENKSVGKKFLSSLDELLKDLSQTETMFVRCIKPNNLKKPKNFDKQLCLSQIKYSGMFETMLIRKNGFPIRCELDEFIQRYRILVDGIPPLSKLNNTKAAATTICSKLVGENDFLIGKTKVFLKEYQDAYLEQLRNTYLKTHVICIQKVIRAFNERNKKRTPIEQTSVDDEEEEEYKRLEAISRTRASPHDLKKYSITHFNLSKAENETDEVGLYSFSCKPLEKPLLRKVQLSDQLSEKACTCFLAIMKYMGDYPSSRSRGPDLTDFIFEPILEDEILVDEIYCQIMKQLTENKSSQSVKYGWQLMWLLTGLCAPSSNLTKETEQFFLGFMQEPMARLSYKRLKKFKIHGCKRKCPPSGLEMRIMHHNPKELKCDVQFQDGTVKKINVDSCSRGKELVASIAKYLKLKNTEGFAIFIKLPTDVVEIQQEEFLFDVCIQWEINSRPIDENALTFSFQRKLWKNVIPTEDPIADLKFHFPQEMHSYTNGFHLCKKVEEAVFLAALLYIIKYPGHPQTTNKIKPVVHNIVPKFLKNKYSSFEWDKKIASTLSCKEIRDLKEHEAKINFLKQMSTLETFGCAFFEIRIVESSMKKLSYIGINEKGLFIIAHESKEIVQHFKFNEILQWNTDENSFYLTIGDVFQSKKVFCQTKQGRKIGDLCDAYKATLVTKKKKARTLNRKSIGGIKKSKTVKMESTAL